MVTFYSDRGLAKKPRISIINVGPKSKYVLQLPFEHPYPTYFYRLTFVAG